MVLTPCSRSHSSKLFTVIFPFVFTHSRAKRKLATSNRQALNFRDNLAGEQIKACQFCHIGHDDHDLVKALGGQASEARNGGLRAERALSAVSTEMQKVDQRFLNLFIRAAYLLT